MSNLNNIFYILITLSVSLTQFLALGQNYIVDFKQTENEIIKWCTTSVEEQRKCSALSQAVERDRIQFGSDYRKITCKQAFNKDECMSNIDEESSDITVLDAGEVFIGGRYHSLIPIAQEVYPDNARHYYSVAVIKKNTLTEVYTLRDLRGKKGCFASVGSLAGWVFPVYTLMKEGGMEVIDCNNHVKSTINFFGPSCAVNSLLDKYNPIGDNSDKLCQLCIGRVPGEKCTSNDPYANFEGAFKCLVEKGDIAFLKHTTVQEMVANTKYEFASFRKDNFELLCRDGSRRSVDDFHTCNWGRVPTHAYMTSSVKTSEERKLYQRFLKKLVRFYGKGNGTYDDYSGRYSRDEVVRNKRQNYIPNSSLPPGGYDPKAPVFTQYEKFKLFDSVPVYGLRHNLLVQDVTVDIVPLEETRQTYTGYLGESLRMILGIRDCPVNRMTLCVTSDAEMEKCVKMRTALKAQLLKPEMVCYKGHSQINCMQAIKNGNSDVAVLDAGDVYTAGLHYDLIPFMSEVYNLGEPEYYVVAVAKEEDPSTELTYLKGKYTCHTGINTGAGWIMPLAFLISNGWIRSYGCNSVRAAAEYFTKSCVPGALSTEYNIGVPYDNMCDLCHGVSYRYCRRDASEDYFGHTGAFRCLVEGGGNVAFVKHTTVIENTDGKRKEWWARNTLTGDYELLCPDGTRAQMHDYKTCNLGKVKANAVVSRGGYGYNETQLDAFINLFVYAQQFYGRRDEDDFSFSMFYSFPPYSDLIFQDATKQLKPIPPHMRYYDRYLGRDFMRAKRIVDCHAGSNILFSSLVTFTIVLMLNFGLL